MLGSLEFSIFYCGCQQTISDKKQKTRYSRAPMPYQFDLVGREGKPVYNRFDIRLKNLLLFDIIYPINSRWGAGADDQASLEN